MSKDIIMQKSAAGHLMATDATGNEYLQKIPVGRKVGVTITQARNYKFHQKLIILLQYLYDALPRAKRNINGETIEQSFPTFRREMVTISGHYKTEVTMRGDLRVEPQSISYKECSEELAQRIYSDVIDKALELLGNDQSRDDLDDIVNNILAFDG